MDRSLVCTVCLKKKERNNFMRPFKQRLIIYTNCNACYDESLLRDLSGRAINSARSKGFISDMRAKELLEFLKYRRADAERERRAKLSEKAKTMWEHRRDLERRFGIRAPTPTERKLFMEDPAARAAFAREQEKCWAAYKAQEQKEEEYRQRVSEIMTGKKRGPYVTAKQRIRADAQKKRVLALIDAYEKEDTGKPAPAGNGHQE